MKDLTDERFEEAIAAGNVLVDFWAPWCAPCKAVGVVLAELEPDFSDITFCKIDIDTNMKAAGRHQVRSIPTVILFRDGEVQDTIIGANTLGIYAGRLKALLHG